MVLTLELRPGVVLWIWPKWKRAAIVTPHQCVSLSLSELRTAIREAGSR